ncbi:MAG: type II toxin-antitoxin system RelE/ParE family toxin [Longimicrobiales bacterium]|nr:type II toxin-antitoxin system RelE/ParE family toxin [Longimicrobiales bacterium]
MTSLRLVFAPEARLDILAARTWYEEQSPGLGWEFSRAVEAATAALLRFPKSFPQVHGEVRKAVLRRFPYSLLYVLEGDDLTVLGCFHQRRNPHSWQALS